MKKLSFVFRFFIPAFVLISYPLQSFAKDLTIVSSLESKILYDDNLDFDDKDEVDAFGANATPGVTLNYKTELGETSLLGEVDVIRYFKETDYDRTMVDTVYFPDGHLQVTCNITRMKRQTHSLKILGE
jgi:hypothetical protein